MVPNSIDISIKNLDCSYPEIQGEISEVAKAGVIYISNKIKKPIFVEDAGLFIRALNNFPGTFSKFVFEKIGNKGILKLMEGIKDRYAEFRSVIAFFNPLTMDKPKLFEGIVKGKISYTIRGTHGFGYDPIFFTNGKTFGELTRSEKNQLSHRSKSFNKLLHWLEKNRRHLRHGEAI
jgi:XTP/dITP diphosphohydrolase